MLTLLLTTLLTGGALSTVTTTAFVENGISIGLIISEDHSFNTATLAASAGKPSVTAGNPVENSAAGSTIWDVQVGTQGDLSFTPNQISAAIGDTVQFTFGSLNHSLSQSTLDAPCALMPGGFDTGFNQYNPSGSDNIMVSFTVNSPEPQFFFCGQNVPVSHCQLGMVFAINPGTNMDTFLSNVLAFGAISSLASTTAPASATDSSLTGATITSLPNTLLTSTTNFLLGPIPTDIISTFSTTGSDITVPTSTGSLSSNIQVATAPSDTPGSEITVSTGPGSLSPTQVANFATALSDTTGSDITVSTSPGSISPTAQVATFTTAPYENIISTSLGNLSPSVQVATTTFPNTMTDTITIPTVVMVASSVLSLSPTDNHLTVLDAHSPSAPAKTSSPSSNASSSLDKRALATAEAVLVNGSASGRALAVVVLIALGITTVAIIFL